MVILDPGTLQLNHRIVGLPYRMIDKQRHQTVEIEHIKKTAAEGMAEALESCRKRPKLEPPRSSGFMIDVSQ